MRATLAPRWTTLLVLTAWLTFPAPGAAQASTKPSLSEEIGKVIDKDGVEAGKQRFKELYPEHQDEYDVDPAGFLALVSKYMQSGNTAAGQEVAQMMTVVTQGSMGASGVMPPAPTETKATPTPAAPSTNGPQLGPPRDDLDRFVGLYGDPNRTDKNRMLWVAKGCTGHLVAGAYWGDASPWWMRSTSEVVFEATVFGGEVLRFEFPAHSQTMVHELDYMPSPLPRLGPLPDDWEECVTPGWG